MSDELKACPFCGNQSAVMDWLPSLSGIVEYPFCEYCGAQCETAELWNTRPIEDGLHAELDEARAEVRRLKDEVADLEQFAKKVLGDITDAIDDLSQAKISLRIALKGGEK